MKKCLIIDSYGFIFRAFHVQKNITSPNGEPIGAIFGFTSMLIKLLSDMNPTHVVAVFDSGGKNFRHEIYKEYKSHRPPVPEELIHQFPIARQVVEVMNVKSAESYGYEADDVIATIAAEAARNNEEVIVVTADKDLAQLMSDKIKIYDPVKSKFIEQEDIEEKFGVRSDKIRDVLALIGDKSDNIPGVPSFGPKTASELINKFGSFENLCNSFEEIDSEKKREVFRENIDKAKLSYDLAGLRYDVDIQISFDEMLWNKPSMDSLSEFLNKYGFRSLLQRITKISDKSQKQMELLGANNDVKTTKSDIEISEDIKLAHKIAESCGYISIIFENDICFLASEGRIFKTQNLSEIKDIAEDASIKKIVYSSKEIFKKFVDCSAVEDISILSYILSAGNAQQDIYGLMIRYCNLNISSPEQICLNLKTLMDSLYKEIFKQKMMSLYIDIDLPISKILSEIEKVGVKFDTAKLAELSNEFEGILIDLAAKIFQIAGKEFNIGSPKQLGEILFNDLKLPTGSKTGKTKAFSTGVEVLEELAENGYEIAQYLLKWRQISKLKSTYTDSLQKQVNPSTNRIHTTLLQTSTATGRLSSTEPNLQNIPIRSSEGERIRNTVVAEKGFKLISADYSQIELRILAEIANIKELKEAFANNIDIHTKTASQVFGTSIQNVTQDLRRKAKAINFGIIYGISGFGLAKQLGISRTEAKEYIDKYFAAYPGIKEYMENTKTFATEHGYVENFFKRKCYVPLIKSSNGLERSFAERAAINAPIQGSASDIAKIAMIKLDQALRDGGFRTKMILQIHDELIFESPENEVDKIMPLIKKSMENAVNFSVKLKVDIEVSDHWS
jgi:DNA polymerase-1